MKINFHIIETYLPFLAPIIIVLGLSCSHSINQYKQPPAPTTQISASVNTTKENIHKATTQLTAIEPEVTPPTLQKLLTVREYLATADASNDKVSALLAVIIDTVNTQTEIINRQNTSIETATKDINTLKADVQTWKSKWDESFLAGKGRLWLRTSILSIVGIIIIAGIINQYTEFFTIIFGVLIKAVQGLLKIPVQLINLLVGVFHGKKDNQDPKGKPGNL